MDDPERCWEVGWQGHEDAQLRRVARWSLREKIIWLEEAARLAEYIRKQANPAADSADAGLKEPASLHLPLA